MCFIRSILTFLACGVAKIKKCKFKEWIIGGQEICPHSRPWVAGLSVLRNGYTNVCSGALINERHVLTAAHCSWGWYNPTDPYKFSKRRRNCFICNFIKVRWVLLGSHDIEMNENKAKYISIIDYIVHPKWHDMAANMVPDEKFEYDIALVVLNQRVIYGNYIRPICLPQIDKAEDFDHKPVEATGWGMSSWGIIYRNGTKKYNSKNRRLRAVKLLSFKSSTCNSLDTIFQISSSDSNYSSLVCARPTKNKGKNIDACKGDSGGKK